MSCFGLLELFLKHIFVTKCLSEWFQAEHAFCVRVIVCLCALTLSIIHLTLACQ